MADDGAQINIAAIPVAGVGGLGLVAMAAVIAFTYPEVMWALILGISAGTALACALIVIHRRANGDQRRSILHL